jgi:hypothetical protein
LQIKDLMQLLGCKKDKALEKVNVSVSYLLFRISLCGKDKIPGVGELTLSEDREHVIIKLEEKWITLLKGGSFEEVTLAYLKRIVKAEDDR